jgi:peptidoglycan/LPS O-acetylase OafA/YrhL
VEVLSHLAGYCVHLARGTLSRFIATALTAAVLIWNWNTPGVTAFDYTVLLMGAFLALLMHDRRGFAFVRHLMSPAVSMLIFIAFIIMQGEIHRIQAAVGDAVMLNIYSVGVVLLIPAILGPGLPRRLLSSRPFVFVGERSYSLYLVQILAAQSYNGVSGGFTGSMISVVMITGIGLVYSDFLYRWVEQPMIAKGHRLASRWATRVPSQRDLFKGDQMGPLVNAGPIEPVIASPKPMG